MFIIPYNKMENIKSQIIITGYIERFWNNFEKIGKENLSHTYLISRFTEVILGVKAQAS
jgi:hypothetical protein